MKGGEKVKRNKQKMCEMVYEENKSIVFWYLRKNFNCLTRDDQYEIMNKVWGCLSENIHEVIKRNKEERTAWILVVVNREVVAFLRAKGDNKTPSRENSQGMEKIMVEGILSEGVLKNLPREEKETLLGDHLKQEEEKEKATHTNTETKSNYRLIKGLAKCEMEGGMNEQKQ